MKIFISRKPFWTLLITATAVSAATLIFLNAIAYAQGQTPAAETPSQLKGFLEVCTLLGVLFAGLSFGFTQIYNLWRKYNVEQEVETGATWKKLAESRKEDNTDLLADKNRLEADKVKLESEARILRERLKKQKKLTLRLIAKIEGDGSEFDEAEDYEQ